MKEKFIRRKGIYPLNSGYKEKNIFGFDVETANNGKTFVCCSIVGDNYSKFFRTKKSFLKELTSNQIFRNSFIIATNLTYDFYAIFDLNFTLKHFKVIDRASSLIFADTYISYNKVDNNFYSKIKLESDKRNIKDFYKITFIDSLNHFKGSVKKLGEIIKIPKLETPTFLSKKPKNKKEWDIMKKYNIRDSEVTFKFMKFLQSKYNSLGFNLKVTISSSAMDCFRRKYINYPIYSEDEKKILFQYKGYYGGRTEAIKRGLFDSDNYGKIKSYDVNSLYPYCMKTFKYPLPDSSSMVKKITTEDIESFEGIGYFELKAPNINMPIVPLRLDKLLFPIGYIKGYYTFSTIRYALNNEYEILKLGSGIVYQHTFRPFKTMIDDLYKKRTEYKKNKDDTELAIKIIMNSLYGKFGFRYDDKEFLCSGSDIHNYINKKEYEIYPTADKGIFRIKTNNNSIIPDYVMPILASYTTSYARIDMHKHFKRTGFDRILYTDTDCIFTTRKLYSSKDIGELKLENTFNKLIIVKPKMYAGITSEKNIIRVKGIHSITSYNKFENLIKKEFTVKDLRFRKVRGCIGSKDKYTNQTFYHTKTLDLQDNKRNWNDKTFKLIPQDSSPIVIS